MAIVETNAEPRVRQKLGHHAVEFDQIFLGQSRSLLSLGYLLASTG
jgi:hypothetical protein